VELILVRHGLPVRTEPAPGARATPPDPDLSVTGRDQAQRVAAVLGGERIDTVYASPLRRAVQTVEPLAARLGLPILLEPGVHEIDMGEDTYIPIEELLPDEPRTQLYRELLADPNSALFSDFRTTVGAAVDAIITRHPGQTVIVACHAGVISAALTHLLGVPRTFAFRVDYASATRVRVSRDGRLQVLSVNDRCHLMR
jgi:broad specificity phosphatase PhoE